MLGGSAHVEIHTWAGTAAGGQWGSATSWDAHGIDGREPHDAVKRAHKFLPATQGALTLSGNPTMA